MADNRKIALSFLKKSEFIDEARICSNQLFLCPLAFHVLILISTHVIKSTASGEVPTHMSLPVPVILSLQQLLLNAVLAFMFRFSLNKTENTGCPLKSPSLFFFSSVLQAEVD